MILVVGHSDNILPLPNGYRFVQRISPETLNIEGVHKFRNSSLVWSEYSAWFENREEFEIEQTSGLFHYRCALNLTKINFLSLPFRLRKLILSLNKRETRIMENYLIVGEPIHIPGGMWLQYLERHPGSISYLELAAKFYDELMEMDQGSTLERLKNNRQFYIRNIFTTDTNFGKLWVTTAMTIAQQLDDQVEDNSNDRWGGFILERLFSLYIEDFVRVNNVEFTTAKFIYFVNSIDWIKNYAFLKWVQIVKRKVPDDFRLLLKKLAG